jgi:hypothetical protein
LSNAKVQQRSCCDARWKSHAAIERLKEVKQICLPLIAKKKLGKARPNALAAKGHDD